MPGLVGGQLAAVVVTLGALLALGERTRLTFFLLYLPHLPFALWGALGLVVALVARRGGLVAAATLGTLIALFPLMGLRVGFPRAPHGKPLRILTYNVFYNRYDHGALIHELTSAGADVIVLQANRSSFGPELSAALPGWTVQASGEFLLATRLALRDVEVPNAFPVELRPCWVRYALVGPSGPFQVFNVHPESARRGLTERTDWRSDIDTRRQQIAWATAEAGKSKEPVILAGDTNLPPWSALGREFLTYGDAFEQVGRGFGYTFPNKVPWMRIDRLFGGPGIRWLDVRTLPRGASDHRAVVADFEIELR